MERQLFDKMSLHLDRDPRDWAVAEDLLSLAWNLGRDDALGREVVKYTVGKAKEGFRLAGDDVSVIRGWHEMLERCLFFQARYDVDAYFQYVEWDRDVDKRFYLPRRPHLRSLIQGFQDILDGVIRVLGVSMPPGTGKTTALIFFISMIMGLYPDRAVLASAHSGDLTRSIFDGIHEMVLGDEYRWRRVFDTAVVEGVSLRDETINLGEPKRFKTLTCRSIGATIVGATRAQSLLAADDMVKNLEEALNYDRLEKLWGQFTTDLLQRMSGDEVPIINIGTRWSVHDPMGRLQRHAEAKGWPSKFIQMPALSPQDESNFDYPCEDNFSTKFYLDLRGIMDPVSWESLYQQEPIEREGLLFHEEGLRRFFDLPEEAPDTVIAVCDTKDSGKDYLFMPVAYVYGMDYYIADCICTNRVMDEVLEARIDEMLRRHDVRHLRVESNSAGGQIAKNIRDRVKKRNGATRVTTRYTTKNKETRIINSFMFVTERCLFLDNAEVQAGGDYFNMLRFLTTYTVSGKNKHDDVPDGMSMLEGLDRDLFSNRTQIIQSPLR